MNDADRPARPFVVPAGPGVVGAGERSSIWRFCVYAPLGVAGLAWQYSCGIAGGVQFTGLVARLGCWQGDARELSGH